MIEYFFTGLILWIPFAIFAAKTTDDFDEFFLVAGLLGVPAIVLWPAALFIVVFYFLMYLIYQGFKK